MVKSWVAYSLVRVGVFGLVFAGLLLVGLEWWLAALIAAVIGFCVAYIFFRGLRDAVARDIEARRTSTAKHEDAVAEDLEQ